MRFNLLGSMGNNRDAMKKIKNLTFSHGRWMTEADELAITALNVARGLVDKGKIEPIREKGKIRGFIIPIQKMMLVVTKDLFHA